MLTSEEINKLVETAQKARINAMDFKSKHAIGAAVLTGAGNCFGGCNIDAVISSQGTCAEALAINHAVAHGECEIKAIGVIDDKFTFPCGACLQYLCQFSQVSGKEIEVVVIASDGKYEIKTLSELLPNKFISKTFATELESYAGKNR